MSPFAAILAALAVLSSAFTPFGFMPVRADDGSFVLMVCTGVQTSSHGSTEAVDESDLHAAHSAHHDPQPHGGDDAEEMESRCNFAVTSACDLPTPNALENRIVPASVDAWERLTPITGIFPPNLPPSTGPPAC